MARHESSLYDVYVDRMRQANATNLTEVAVRLGIVTACTIAAFFVLFDPSLLVWVAVYIVTTVLYVTALKRQGPQISTRRYWSLMLLHWGIAAWFAALPVYIATRGDVMSLYIGYSAVCGLALHNISRRSMTPHVAWGDVGTVVVAGIVITLAFINAVPETSMAIVVSVVGLSLIGYYVHTFIESDRMRRIVDEQQAQDRQTQKMRAVGQLTSGIAHDFNNILTVIRGNLDLHDALDDTKSRQDVLDEARSASEKAAHLVAQLLAFSRKSNIAPQPRPVAETLDAFVTLARRTLPATNRIALHKPLPNINIVADPTLLQNALLNAAVNARDAMGPDGGTLDIQVKPLDAPPWPAAKHLPRRLYACIILTDTGPGVDPNLLEKLTEPFYTSKPVGQGSGLGLSMIKGFAEQSGGHLHLANAAKGGLELSLLLPAAERST